MKKIDSDSTANAARRWLLAMACCCLAGIASAEGLSEPLPAQPLAIALERFAEQTGLQLVYRSEHASALQSEGAAAGLSIERTLESLLRNTGLTFEFLNERTIVIRPKGELRTRNATLETSDTHLLPAVYAPEGADGADGATVPDEGIAPLEEIIVSARRRDESLTEVPIAVSAFTRADISELRLQSMEDVARFTPGLTFIPTVGRQDDRPVVRGVGSVVTGIGGAGTAAKFIDGVYVGGSVSSTELFNLERVEVIKGPQSAQFGRGTYAGAINYVTRRPSRVFEGGVSGSVAEHSSSAVSGWLSGPVIDNQLYFYVAAGSDRYGGEYRNTYTGALIGQERTTSATGKLQWEPLDSVSITARVGWFDQDDGLPPRWLQPRTANNCFFRTAAAPRSREYYCGRAITSDTIEARTDLFESLGGAGIRTERVLGTLDIAWELDSGITIRSLTGLIDETLRNNSDNSYAAYDPLVTATTPPSQLAALSGGFFTSREFEQRDFSQELRALSSADHKIRWVVGVYYYAGSKDEVRSDKVIPPGVLGNALPIVTANLGPRLESIDNRAAFAGVDWDVSKRLTLGLEARYAEDEVEVTSVSLQAGAPATTYRATFGSFTPRITAVWRWTQDWNVYANIARGTRPGTFNANVPIGPDGLPDESQRAVDEEQATSLEFGLKGAAFGGRVATTLAAYRTELRDQQSTSIIELPSGLTTTLLKNVGATRIHGLEAEARIRASRSLEVSAMISWIDAQFTREFSVDQADLLGSTGTFSDVIRLGSVAGNRPPRVPEWQGALGVRWSSELTQSLSVFASSDLTYLGSRFAQEHNLIETGGTSNLGSQVGVRGANWSVRLWGKNLLDDDSPIDVVRYIDSRFGALPSFPAAARGSATPRGFVNTLQKGRQIGVAAEWNF